MVTSLERETVVEVESAVDSWMTFADWLSDRPPRFYSADKSSFEGMNFMAAPMLQVAALVPDDAKIIDWDGCNVQVEFVANMVQPMLSANGLPWTDC